MEDYSEMQRTYPNTKLMSRISVGYYLKELTDSLVAVAHGKKAVKLEIHAAHDTTIAGLLTAFGDDRKEWVPFASSLLFELLKSRSDGAFFVRVIYNGEILSLKGYPSLIPLEQFEQLANNLVPSFEECSEAYFVPSSKKSVVALIVILSISAVVLIVAVVIFLVRRKRNETYMPMDQVNETMLI